MSSKLSLVFVLLAVLISVVVCQQWGSLAPQTESSDSDSAKDNPGDDRSFGFLHPGRMGRPRPGMSFGGPPYDFGKYPIFAPLQPGGGPFGNRPGFGGGGRPWGGRPGFRPGFRPGGRPCYGPAGRPGYHPGNGRPCFGPGGRPGWRPNRPCNWITSTASPITSTTVGTTSTTSAVTTSSTTVVPTTQPITTTTPPTTTPASTASTTPYPVDDYDYYYYDY